MKVVMYVVAEVFKSLPVLMVIFEMDEQNLTPVDEAPERILTALQVKQEGPVAMQAYIPPNRHLYRVFRSSFSRSKQKDYENMSLASHSRTEWTRKENVLLIP